MEHPGDHAVRREWLLGPAANFLAQPHREAARRVLNDAQLEGRFVLGSWSRQHALLAVLDILRHQPDREVDLGALRESFNRLEPTEFVGLWLGEPVRGLEGIFHRLGAQRAESAGAYVKLIAILRDDGVGAATLRHTQVPTFEAIERLHALPDWARVSAVLEMRFQEASTALLIVRTLRAQGRLASDAEAQAFLCSRRSSIFERLVRAGVDIHFPQPPWPGVADLRPVGGLRDLLRVADRFSNCLGATAEQAVEGSVHYYAWEGEEPAVVELQRVMGLAWIISEIAGVENSAVSRRTEDQIRMLIPLDEINQQYCHQRLSLGDPNAAA
ncbi:hypothetical protein [Phenylobacterium sp.]|uniref:hypothetical protein n=1 Tax=Phenylobacterium sp. TaxID=1871053 RepID=UPI002FD8CA12